MALNFEMVRSFFLRIYRRLNSKERSKLNSFLRNRLNKNYDVAIKVGEELVDSYPFDFTLLNLLAKTYLAVGQNIKAKNLVLLYLERHFNCKEEDLIKVSQKTVPSHYKVQHSEFVFIGGACNFGHVLIKVTYGDERLQLISKCYLHSIVRKEAEVSKKLIDSVPGLANSFPRYYGYSHYGRLGFLTTEFISGGSPTDSDFGHVLDLVNKFQNSKISDFFPNKGGVKKGTPEYFIQNLKLVSDSSSLSKVLDGNTKSLLYKSFVGDLVKIIECKAVKLILNAPGSFVPSHPDFQKQNLLVNNLRSSCFLLDMQYVLLMPKYFMLAKYFAYDGTPFNKIEDLFLTPMENRLFKNALILFLICYLLLLLKKTGRDNSERLEPEISLALDRLKVMVPL